MSFTKSVKGIHDQTDRALDELVARNKARFCSSSANTVSSNAKPASNQADDALDDLVARNKAQVCPTNAKATSIQDLGEADPGFIGANLVPLPDCLPDNIAKEIDPEDPPIISDNQELMSSSRLEESHSNGGSESDILNHAIESSNDKEYDKKKSPSRISAKERMALRNAPLQSRL